MSYGWKFSQLQPFQRYQLYFNSFVVSGQHVTLRGSSDEVSIFSCVVDLQRCHAMILAYATDSRSTLDWVKTALSYTVNRDGSRKKIDPNGYVPTLYKSAVVTEVLKCDNCEEDILSTAGYWKFFYLFICRATWLYKNAT
jgi:hypothetical protein